MSVRTVNLPEMNERQTADVDAARRHDEPAFERLVEPHRAALHAHCYRMLGSTADAEDAAPGDAAARLARAAGLRGPQLAALVAVPDRHERLPAGDRAAPEAGAARRLRPGRATRTAVRRRRSSSRSGSIPTRTSPLADGAGSPEARYEQRESVELAFVAALQHLPDRQRAVLLLRDVLGFAPAEIAETLEDHAGGRLQRPAARPRGGGRAASGPQPAGHAALDRRRADRARSWTATCRRGTTATSPALVAMLTDDATFAMPPMPTWYRGRAAIGAFLAGIRCPDRRRWRMVPVRASGQLAFGCYVVAEPGAPAEAHDIEVLTLAGDGRISDVTAFLTPAAFSRFGLPPVLEP